MSLEELQTADFIRDYIYVDNPRIQSHLSQLLGGLPDEEQGKVTKAWQAGFRQIGVYSRSASSETTETRSLANLHAAMLEEQALAAGMLIDVSELASKQNVWTKNRFRKMLKPGGLIKVHAATQIVAAAEITELVNKLDAFSTSNPIAEQVRMILGSMYGKELGIRVYPCGPGVPERVFMGLFADVGDYIGAERPLLIPRFGSEAQDLTTILQITRVPGTVLGEQAVTRASLEQTVQSMRMSSQRVERSALETMLMQMLRMLESVGVLEAPAYPAVGVLPLAVYRDVAPVQNFSVLEEQLLREDG